MELDRLNRRGFLRLVCISLAAVIWKPSAAESSRWAQSTDLRFYVAGVRFHKPVPNLESGDRVTIKPELFRGALCYAILAENGRRIGYVPKTLISAFQGRHIVSTHVSSVQRHAVPWKRFEIISSVR